MHRRVVTADVSTTAKACAELIAREHIGCLIILRKKRPVGIVTERSFVHLMKKGAVDPDTIKAGDFMSSPLISIDADATFSAAMEAFSRDGVKRLPVMKDGHVVGLLSLKGAVEFSHLALASLEERHHKLQKRSAIDVLTGVRNKAAITRALEKEYERIRQYGGRSSVLLMDVDHFKQVNDRHSHMAGDEVLRQLGAVLTRECRQIDTVGRFGGEEFLVVAPNRNRDQAVRFGERLRKAIMSQKFQYKGRRLRLTVSLGVACLFEGRGYKYALESADKALYHAKAMGRNRVGLFRDGRLSIETESAG